MKTALNIQHLSLGYRGFPVLKELDFTVQQGEFFIILGPNGSGKTSLLKSIAGLLPLTHGQVQIFARQLSAYHPRQLAHQLAYVAQSAGNDESFTVQEMVLMGRAPYLGLLGIEGKEDRAIAQQAIGDMDLTHLAAKRLNNISGGERQRAQIARAICQQTPIILLDEPTAALDPGHQIHIMNMLTRLKKDRKTTLIMVSHDLNLAAMYADHLLLLADGKISAYGPPEEVIQETLLSRVYGCPMLVDRSPAGNWPRANLLKNTLSHFQQPDTCDEHSHHLSHEVDK